MNNHSMARIVSASLVAVSASIICSQAQAQNTGVTDPCNLFYYDAVPTTGQWNACFNSLERSLGYTPVNSTGGTMTGPLGITQLFGASGTPTVVAGTGAGTSPTVTLVSAFDSDFGLSIVTGSSPATSAVIATVTFSSVYISAPHCTFSPTNASADALVIAAKPYGTSTTATWVLNSDTTALTASTTYTWDVICIG